MTLALVVLVIALALAFDFTNGFHDAANAIATSISTRALTPRVAMLMAAVFNLLGALIGEGVAKTIGSGIVDLDAAVSQQALFIVLSGLCGSIVWNLFSWWRGLPTSSSHALIGGLMGAGVASFSTVKWSVIGEKVIIPMVLSPVVGFIFSYLFMVGILWAFRKASVSPTMRGFRLVQTVSAAAMALGHGLQDAQKTMGVIVLALVAGNLHEGTDIPLWVKFAAAGAISLGTLAGGQRIISTLGRKLIDLDPARGFAAEAVAAGVLYSAAAFGAPISTTQSITASIMGAGATRRLKAVRWGVVKSIVTAWILTIPCAGIVAAIIYLIINALFG